MKKKALLLASMGVLACTVGVTALAVGGANQLDTFAATASPTEYSVTFDANDESKTTIETIDDNYAICTTTAGGNKVGVVGFDNTEEMLSFRNAKCAFLFIFEPGTLEDAKAYAFGHIAGFTVDFDGDLMFEWDDEEGTHLEHPENGTRFNVTCTPYDHPVFEGFATITSLTVHYTC